MTPASHISPAERAAGLDMPLPAGERILWQGKPAARPFTRSVFRLRGLALYGLGAAAVVAALAWRDRPLGQAIAVATLLLPFFAVAWGLLTLVGRAEARASTYTLTNRRLILHIGVAYEMTVSIPLSTVVGAALRRRRDGSGEIALAVGDDGGVGYLALWPHARFGYLRKPQPMLRGLADPDAVRELIGDALIDYNAGGRTRVVAATPVPVPVPAEEPRPVRHAVAA